MRTREEQLQLLSRLIGIAKAGQEAGETEWLEMKTNISESHASITYDRVGEYISGLSNGACTHYKDYGYLVLGVEDGTWNIVGTNLRMKSARYRQQDYELWLRNNVAPRMVHFNIEDSDFICENQKRRLFPMPVYELSDGRVELTIYGKVIDEQYAWQLSTNSSLTFLDIEMLNRVQLNRPITEDEWKYLKKKKLVSGRKERPYVVGAVEKKDNHLCLEILDLLRRNNEMSKAEIEGTIIDKLAEEMSENQKHDKITNLLKRMKKEKQIDTTGKGPSAKWFIIK